jgi:phthalate 4,5-dioxygenase reductase component
MGSGFPGGDGGQAYRRPMPHGSLRGIGAEIDPAGSAAYIGRPSANQASSMQALNPELVRAVRVRAAALVARDVREFELVAADGGELPAFTPGAHILIQAPSGATRRYSLSNAPDERDRYVIAIKREAGGRGGSISMVDDVKPGDTLYISLPRNDFELKAAQGYVFIAGGIGITPIRSMVQHVAAAGDRPWRLYYLTRDPEVTAYREVLSGPDMRGKVVIHHDRGDAARSFDLWPVLEKPKGHVYCCGPRGLMEAVRDMTGHWPTSAVHFEDFGAGTNKRTAEDKPFVVRVGADGAPIEVAANVTMLEALRAHGHRIPSSCESGTCGSCKARLIAGEPDHRDLVLTDAERRDHVMPCVSRAHSAELVIEP